MLHFCCVKYGKYSPQNVNQLYESISKVKQDFVFHCLTDDSRGLNSNIRVIDFDEPPTNKRQWNKLRFFDPKFIQASPTDEVIISDIDQVFIGDPLKLLDFPVESGTQFYSGRWWTNQPHGTPINSGFSKFIADGSNLHVYKKFLESPNYWMTHYHLHGERLYKEKFPPFFGEQRFIWNNLRKTHTVKWFPLEYFVRYDPKRIDTLKKSYSNIVGGNLFENGKLNPRTVIVHFSGLDNNISDIKEFPE